MARTIEIKEGNKGFEIRLWDNEKFKYFYFSTLKEVKDFLDDIFKEPIKNNL